MTPSPKYRVTVIAKYLFMKHLRIEQIAFTMFIAVIAVVVI
jgi:hypothetical protein